MKLFCELFLCAFLTSDCVKCQLCTSKVYCDGFLLRTVQLARLFNDSKTFVDMKMKNPYETTLVNFEEFMSLTRNKPSKAQVGDFVKNNFESGEELEPWQPPDYKEDPTILATISDPVIRDFARQLVEIWPKLARKVKTSVTNATELYSLIPVPNGFIIPGGRFKEYYYWDSYWIVKGLLLSEMKDTARGMIENFIYLVKKYGFVPNGGRIYYLNRSDPPFLTKMVTLYYRHTKDRKWLAENIQHIQKEVEFWIRNKTVTVSKNGKEYLMARFHVEGEGPRPEAYVEDITTANFYPGSSDKEKLYAEIKTAAESGWDFSTRWIIDGHGGNACNLTCLQTSRIIPVDLNSYLCEAFHSLSYLYSELNDSNNSIKWDKIGNKWKRAIQAVLWDGQSGIWYDYNYELRKSRPYFYGSNFAPLWTGCFEQSSRKVLGMRALKYLHDLDMLEFPGGIAASLIESGEQWDFPNAWAPLQAIVIQALEYSGAPLAVSVARNLAFRWIKSNLRGFRDGGDMFEKYDALHPGKYGGGGEYVVQSGFGWTNGVALEFIAKYFSNSDYNLENSKSFEIF